MRGTGNLPLKNIFRQMNTPNRGQWRSMSIWVPKKPENDKLNEESTSVGKVEAITTFSKPPPLPPVLGPLIVLSLLEMGSDSDADD